MKNKIILALLLVMITIPYKVSAAEEKITISCNPTSIKAGNTTECTIKGTANESIIAVSSQIILSSNLTAVSFEPSSTWEQDGKDIDNGKIEVYSESDVNGEFTLGVLKVKAKSNVINKNETITLKTSYQNDKSNDANVNTRSISDVTASIRIPNNNSSLKSLEVLNHELDKEFTKAETEYNLETTKKNIEIRAVPTDENAKVDGTGVISLNDGNNEIKIKVTAEDNSTTTYIINAKLKSTSDDKKSDENLEPSGDNRKGEKKDKIDDELTTNSKTGSTMIIVVAVLLIASLIATLYFVKKKNNNK